ncbi:MAG: DUF1989 domain-containing protein [Cyanophyceae cyanobacterium]
MTTLATPLSSPPLDVPAPLGTVVAEYRIDAASAIAYRVQAGQYIQIIDVEGAQCSDFLAFAGDDYSEELDGTVTRTLNALAMPQAGLHGKYFSQNMQPLVEVIQDTCGRHDSFLLACTDKYYEEAGYPGHGSCSQNFNLALQPYGLAPRPGWAAVNFFFNTSIDCHGEIVSEQSWSRPGDYVLLEAKQDLLCASSACPDDIDPANGWNPTPIHVRIYDAGEHFAKAIGRRAAPDAPVRLTQPSGFTRSIRELTDDLVEYNGFWVPNRFANHGDHDEYWALREQAVLLDLSALRKFEVTGEDALALLQRAFSRDVAKLAVGQSTYGCLLNHHGGIIDDGIVFRLGESAYRYVGNCDTDRDWLEKVARQDNLQVAVQPASHRLHNLAIQGPLARKILRSLTQLDPQWQLNLEELRYFRFATGCVAEIPVLISRTGYTGELGYELFVHPDDGAALWQRLLAAGKPLGLMPMGMLALDRARIEAGLLSAGYEFDDLTSPYQAGIGWTVALKKPDFIGKAALEKIKAHPPKVAVGLVLDGNRVASHGQCVYALGERWRAGTITSGTFSPLLNRSIALAQVVPEYAEPGTTLEVGFLDGQIRHQAVVGPLAAYDPSKSKVRS